ncbi:hypothetical protein [Thalassolituus sp. C2-1]|uniref:hypothetical protein n=1 Tax=Venatorbacter sp. C2-1 TaxID=2597518 RepID=UPI001193841C|nr:hypothetical protein [Thalassolituus sp. C2-1]TVV43112.1 hypothetical protein FOT50_11760 [Thalassolituus sp. C2-1]
MNITLTRSLLVILLPGAMALSPWIVLLLITHPDYIPIYKEYKYELLGIGAGLSVLFGMIFEGISSYVEVRWDDTIGCTYKVEENWHKYLAASYENEPVAYRYISTKVTTMYFEFAMMWVAASSAFGWAWVVCSFKPLHFEAWAWACVIVGLSMSWYFKYMAKSSHELLCIIRLKVNMINNK